MYGPTGWPCDESEVLSERHSDEHVLLEVVTVDGRAASVELRLRPGSVEIWHHRALTAVLDRVTLRQWLARPGPPLAGEGVVFSLDRMVDEQGWVAISLPDVLVWALSPTELHTLRRRV
jgi:hypothetical protein